jgi:hypothetical protein
MTSINYETYCFISVKYETLNFILPKLFIHFETM